ncbi:MAG: hypothetical protein O7F76_03970 [Planctomycetota bacterium]|nr:hypothetical protein [Planctomycetota bacterium]
MRLIHLLVLTIPLLAYGCGNIGPPVLERQVLGYDEITSTLDQKLLLLNIARLSHGHPVHFTATSSIAATFDWTTSIGAGATVAESSGTNLFNFDFGASASENPTFQIVPITGKAFSEQILEPFDETGFQFHVFPRRDNIDRVLRLIVAGFEFQNPDGSHASYVENNPRRVREYEMFRRMVMHLDWLNENRKLFIRPLIFERVVLDGLEVPPRGQDIIKDEGLTWKRKSDGTYLVTRLTAGRLVIMNRDSTAMTDNEQFRLNEKLKKNPKGHVYVEITPDGPGGDFPIRGALKIRSVLQILTFVADGIEFAKEFDVSPDPSTGKIDVNPRATLEIIVTSSPPISDGVWMRYRDRYYSVANTRWDREAFSILGHLFETAVGDVEDVGIPITISK